MQVKNTDWLVHSEFAIFAVAAYRETALAALANLPEPLLDSDATIEVTKAAELLELYGAADLEDCTSIDAQMEAAKRGRGEED